MAVRRFAREHFDASEVEETSAGALVIPARLTRIGVFPYKNPDGTTRREARLPEHVFAADSLATLRNAPLTLEHPIHGWVTPTTWKGDAIGSVPETPSIDGAFVCAPVVVSDQSGIDAVRGGVRELSCGYSADLLEESGTFQGEPYDAVQTNIRYNHLALVRIGRAGPDVRLLTDSGDEMTTTTNAAQDAPPMAPKPCAPQDAPPAAPAAPAAPDLESRIAALEASVAKMAAMMAPAEPPSQPGAPLDAPPPAAPAAPEKSPNLDAAEIRRDERIRVKLEARGYRVDGLSTADALRAAGLPAERPEYAEGRLDAMCHGAVTLVKQDGGAGEVVSTADAARARMLAANSGK